MIEGEISLAVSALTVILIVVSMALIVHTYGPDCGLDCAVGSGGESAVVDLVSDNEDEGGGGKDADSPSSTKGAVRGIAASAPSVADMMGPKVHGVAYARELRLVGGPFADMAKCMPEQRVDRREAQLPSFGVCGLETEEQATQVLRSAKNLIEEGRKR